MVDLHGQYRKIKSEVDQAIQGVLDSTSFINGPEVKLFQQELEQHLGIKHVIPVANGTDALQIAMMALGLKPGDEVITPCFTYIATAEVVALLQLKLVLVDVDPETFNMNPELIEKAITPRTKAIVPVHLFGQCADMESILYIAQKHNLFVIEDTAQAIGATYTFSSGQKSTAGGMGTIGTTSFFPSKNLGCFGDGGAIFCNDDELAATIRMMANHGQRVKYFHETIGVNSRLDTMQAAILRVKLRHLDEYSAARQEVAARYDEAFGTSTQLTVPKRNDKSTHVFHQYTLKLNNVDREELMKKLADKGIPSMIYYPVPLHFQKAYNSLGYSEGDFPVTENLCKVVFSLPIHTEMSISEQNFIIEGVKEGLK